MTCCRLKVVFFVLMNSLVPALVAAMVSFGSGDHVCTTSGSGTCNYEDVEIYPHSDFSLDCGMNSACRDSTIVVGSGSTFTGDFVCGAEDYPSYMSCKNADITFYATDVSTYKVRCQYSGGTSYSCQQTAFTMVGTNAEIQCDSGECQDMVVNVCTDSHVHVSGGLDAGNPVVVNLYGVDATVAFDEAAEYYTISDFAADLCPVSVFACRNGCVIFAGYENDGVCDCPECDDEGGFNCDSCSGGCPSNCGTRIQCSNSFQCDDGCIIIDNYVDDGWCDCSDCEDEPNWNCDSCDCPETCGSYYECFPTTTTPKPTTTTSTPTTTTLTPTTTTTKPTTTTPTPTTTSKPTTTTLKPTTTTLKPTSTTAKPASTIRKPSTTAQKPTAEETTEEPVTSDIENTAEPQTSEQPTDASTTDEVSDSGNDKASSSLEALEWVLISVGVCAIVICVMFCIQRKWRNKQKTKEEKTVLEKPSAVELKVKAEHVCHERNDECDWENDEAKHDELEDAWGL